MQNNDNKPIYLKQISDTSFLNAITSLAEEENGFLVAHEGAEQSAIVLGTIFANTKKSLRMFVGNLSGDICGYQYYFDELKNYLQRGGSLKVLIQDENNVLQSEALKLIQLYSNIRENVIVERTTDKLVIDKEESSKGTPVHFTIGDNNMFRLENDIEDYIGYASFNNIEIVNQLIQEFDSIFLDSHVDL